MKSTLFLLPAILFLGCKNQAGQNGKDPPQKKDYLVAAYYWPAYHHEPLMNEFFRGDIGEWEIIKASTPHYAGHRQPRYPLWGYQMEDDPRVMEQKIEAAHKYGVDLFIWDWYWYNNGPYLEEAINNGLLKAKNVDKIRFYIMWANHDAKTVWDIERSHTREVVWPGAVDRKTFETVVHRIIDGYFGHPSYYKIDGCPVFNIYELTTLIEGLGGKENTIDALNYFRDEVRKAGFPGLHLQLSMRGSYMVDASGVDSGSPSVITPEDIKNMGFKSITHYQWIHVSSFSNGGYADWGMKVVNQWESFGERFGIPYFPHISIDWDNNPRFKEYTPNVPDPSPQAFKSFLILAREYTDRHPDQPPVITINSWNEWSEGGYLEPDVRNGYDYLEAIDEILN